jgi:hypothetical protein
MAERLELLRKQGHTVEIGQLLHYDIVCGTNCWFVNIDTMNLFMLAINNARRIANADQERTEQEATKRRTAKSIRKGTKAAGRKPTATRKAKAARGSVTTGEASDIISDNGVI